MINIEKNGTKYTVSKGSYDTYFKNIGFKVIENSKVKEEKSISKTGEKESKVGDRK